MEYFTNAFKKYGTFTGRETRQAYWMYILIYIFMYIALTVVDITVGTVVLGTIFSLVMFVPSISICARRLHDTNRTGWWQLIGLIPLIGTIVLLVFLVQDSGPDNDHGPNPKQEPEPSAE